MNSGALSGGKAMEAYLQRIAARADKSATLRVGFLEGATYPDGTSVPMVAAIQEFGAPSKGIPPRPYFRNMIAAKKASWGPAIGDLLVSNGYDAEKTLGQAGMGVKGQLQQSIRDLTSPALAPATVAAKGFDKPLVDTGHLLNSVDFDVKT